MGSLYLTVKIKRFISEEDKKERVLTAVGYTEDCAAYQFWHDPRLHLTKYRNVRAMPYYTNNTHAYFYVLLTVHLSIILVTEQHNAQILVL